MSIDDMKIQSESVDRFVVVQTNKMYPGRSVRNILNAGLIDKVLQSMDTHSTDCFKHHDDSITRCSYLARCSAGSDNICSRNCVRRNRQTVNDDGRAQVRNQTAQPGRCGMSAPCPCQPRRQDRPVDLFADSSLPVSNRPGTARARISRNRRSTFDVQPQPCGDQRARRCSYDVEPEPQDSRRGTYDVMPQQCPMVQQNSRRDTYDVPPPCSAGPLNNRRGTYDVSQPCSALRQSDRRGTYDVPQPCQRNTCNSQQPSRASNCRGMGAGNRTGSFSMTGTFQLDEFQGPPPRDRSSQQSFNRLHDTDGDIDDFLDNHLNYDMVAPRTVALPGQPYVHIDESAANTTPDQWRLTLDNRSPIGSQGMGIPSPAGCDDCYSGPRNSPADASRLRRWSSADRQSQPFGFDDSFPMSGTSTPRDRHSRARSAAPECRLSSRRSRRRDTFDRNTR